MNEPNVNETPEHLEPKNAVLGEFESATVGVLTDALGQHGVHPGRLSFLHGPEGLQAYEA
jgi:hypothetical protein